MKKPSAIILLGALLLITPTLQSCNILPIFSQQQSQQQNNPKLSSAELEQIAKAITVKVIGGESGGSGTIIRKVGSTYTVVTNQHVLRAIQGTSKYRAETNSDDELTFVKNIRIQTSDGLDYPATIVKGENIDFQNNDLGLLEFNADRIYDVGTFPKSDVALKPGEKVWAAGFPAEPPQPPLIKGGQFSSESSEPPQPPLSKGGQSQSPLGKEGQFSSEPSSEPPLNKGGQGGFSLSNGEQLSSESSEPPLSKGGQGGVIVTEGEISLIPDQALEQGYQLGYTNLIQSGMSGGPIINSQGDIVGFNGRHGNPLFGDPFVYADGSKPTDGERQKMVGLSWGLPVSVLAQAAPEIMKEVEPPLTGLAKQVYDQAKAVTVRIEARDKKDPSLAPIPGSGVIIAKQKNTYYVVTASHVVEGSDQNYELIAPDGSRYRLDDDKIKQQEGQDVALVQFSSKEIYAVATLADYRVKQDYRPWVFTAGWPKGESLRNPQFEFTPGRLSSSEESWIFAHNAASLTDGYEMVYTNTTLGGMSGGPVMDTQGRVVGIHGRAEGDNSEGVKLGYSLGIPTNTLLGSLQLWGVERQLLQVETTAPPEVDQDQNTRLIAQAVTVTLKKTPNNDTSAKDWINYGNQLWRAGMYQLAAGAFSQAILLDINSYAAWYGRGLALMAENRHREAVQSFELAIASDKENTHYEALREKGKTLFKLKQYSEALASIDQAIQRNNQDAVLYIIRGAILEELNRHQEAVEALTKAIDIKPHSWVYIGRGDARYKSGDLREAIADYNQAIKINPQYAEAYIGRGNARSQSGNLSEAISDYNQAIKINPQYAEAYHNRGLAWYKSGNLSEAISDYNQAIKINPQYAEAYIGRGNAHSQSGDLREAIADYTEAIKINPQYAEAYVGRGAARSDTGDKQGAITDYTQAIKINPQYAEAYIKRGQACYESGDKQKAIADLNQAIKLNPQDARTYLVRGIVSSQSEDLSGAISDFDQAIQLNPQLAEAYSLRGAGRYELGDKQGAISDFDQAIKINSDLPESYLGRGLARYDLGDTQGALSDFDQVIKLNPQDAEAYYHRGTARYDLGNKQEAIGDFTEAIKINPQYAEAYLKRGVLLLESGDKQRAMADFTQAIKLNPQYAEAYAGRGGVRYASGDVPGALNDFDQAIQLNPQLAGAYSVRGNVRLNSGDVPGAISDLDRAIQINSQLAPAYNDRGLARLRSGDVSGAIDDFTQAIKINPQLGEAYANRGDALYKSGDKQGGIEDMQKAEQLLCHQQGKPECQMLKDLLKQMEAGR
ncbi:tetratricopeptide repeat protein [Planktothricoides sp. SR001]|uniref:tetratricopeptide repeat protein n=1 Tax=Planktothricoides sp. SR001 TaxID=1705388 RepID=UPI0006C89D91|nr:tetratricopeptide repeat protein [Planktothricoides sp. SR001]